MQLGSVSYVGAGPGDPELISVRGQQLLRHADLVIHDSSVASELLEQCKHNATLVDARCPGIASAEDIREIARRIIEATQVGLSVVRLKVGDPLFYSRALDEIRIIAAANVKMEIVPGIASPFGASAFAGVPLTDSDGSGSVVFTSATDLLGRSASAMLLAERAKAADTICVLCAASQLPTIVQSLLPMPRFATSPCVLVYKASTPEQRVLEAPLDRILESFTPQPTPEPLLLIAGKVTEWRKQLTWFESLPLFGKRLLLCRPKHQAKDSARLIRQRGARPILLPLIEIGAPPDNSPLNRCATRLGEYDWVVLTSANGADKLMQAMTENGRDARAFGKAKIAVIGPGTARPLSTWGIVPDLVAEEHVAEALAQQLLAVGSTRSVLLVRALEARDVLPNSLREAGIDVDVVAAYATRKFGGEQQAILTRLIGSRSVDAVLLTSSSMVEALCTGLGPDAPAILSNTCVASIGPITSATLRAWGVQVDVTADNYTVDGLLAALESHFSTQLQAAAPVPGNAT